MSLPSVEFLRDQATRLVTYLGDKHRFRLKPASALEAVAAMWRQDDWNTLHGLSQRAAAAPLRATTPGVAPATYPVTWNARYEPDLAVAENDWFRHTLAEGGSTSSRRDWLEQHLLAHMERGAPGVFVNVFGAERVGVRDLHGELEHAGGVPGPLLVNLMADMEPEEIGAMFVALTFPGGYTAADGYWQQSAQRVLTVAARALRETGAVVTLAQLVELFPLPGTSTALERLSARLAPGATQVHLARILSPHSAADAEFSANTWAAHYSLLARGLARLQAEPWAEHLLAGATSAQGIYSLLAQGKCLGVEWPDGSGERAGVAVLHALRSAMRTRMASGEKPAVGWVFAFGDVPAYLSPALLRMLEQARSPRVAILMTAMDARDLSRPPVGQSVLSNVWNRVHLNVRPEQLTELVARIEGGTVLIQPGRLTASLRQ